MKGPWTAALLAGSVDHLDVPRVLKTCCLCSPPPLVSIALSLFMLFTFDLRVSPETELLLKAASRFLSSLTFSISLSLSLFLSLSLPVSFCFLWREFNWPLSHSPSHTRWGRAGETLRLSYFFTTLKIRRRFGLKYDFLPRLFAVTLRSRCTCVATGSQKIFNQTVTPPSAGSVGVPWEWSSSLSECILSKHTPNARESKLYMCARVKVNSCSPLIVWTGPHHRPRGRWRLN